MAQTMTAEDRSRIINIATKFQFEARNKDDGTEYKKQIKLFHGPSGILVFIKKENDYRRSGFKVCVHPERFVDSICNSTNISLWESTQIDPRLTPNSAFKGFPVDLNISKEPLGTCYRVKGDFTALEILLRELIVAWCPVSTRSGSSVAVLPTAPKTVGDEQSEQALDEDIDFASKVKYPMEDIQQRAIRTRRGQPDFRRRLLDAYGCTCAVTGCKIRSVLEAAHIIPHADGTDYKVDNGLPLRADIHTLFDLLLLTVSPDYRIFTNRELAGSEYEKLNGQEIRLPRNEKNCPSPEKLAKHFESFKERNPND